jgi:site-specific recombinase XerD
MGVKIRISHGKIFLDIYNAGNRHWESTGLSVSSDPRQQKEVMSLAEIIRSKRETQLVSEKYNLTDPIASKKTLHSYYSEHIKKITKKTPLKSSLLHLEKYPGGTAIKLSEITHTWARNYLDYLSKDCNLEITTAATYFSHLKQILFKAVRDNIILKNPAALIRCPKKHGQNKVFFDDEELQLIGKTAMLCKNGAEIKKAFIFSCYTGLRISDIKTLKWKHITHTGTKTTLSKQQVKTRRNLDNPVPESAWKLIENEGPHDPEDYIFPYLSSIKSDCHDQLTKWGKKAGISKNLTWHVARRTFALSLLESGADIYTVSKMLGHTSIKTTLDYLKLSTKLSKTAVNNIPEIKLADSG